MGLNEDGLRRFGAVAASHVGDEEVPGLVALVACGDQVHVEAYGSAVPINQVGAVSVPEPRMISVSVWDRALVV